MGEEKKYRKKLFKNTFVFPLYTRTLSTTEYGMVDLITVTITLLLPIFTMNLHEAILRFCLDKNINKSDVLSVGINFSIIGFFIMALISPFIMKLIGASSYITFFLITYILTALKNIFTYYSKGCEKVKLVVALGFLETILILLFNVIFLIKFNLGIYGYYYSAIISGIVVILLYIIMLKVRIKDCFKKNSWTLTKDMLKYSLPMIPNSLCWWISNTSDKYMITQLKVRIKDCFKKNSWTLTKDMLKYSLPMIPNSLCWWISNTSDKYMITHYQGVGASGLYAVAYKVPSLLNTITSIFMQAWQISAVEEYEKKQDGNFSEVYNFLFGINILACIVLILFTITSIFMQAWQISAVEEYEKKQDGNFSEVYNFLFGINILACIVLILFSNLIAHIMFSVEFYDAVKFVPVLLGAYFFNGLASYLGTIYTASKKTKMLFISTLIGAIFNIIMNIILIPSYGGYGAAIATLISYFIIWLIRLVNTRNIVNLYYGKISSIIQIICLILIIAFMEKPEAKFINVFIASIVFVFNFRIIKSIITFIKRKVKI